MIGESHRSTREAQTELDEVIAGQSGWERIPSGIAGARRWWEPVASRPGSDHLWLSVIPIPPGWWWTVFRGQLYAVAAGKESSAFEAVVQACAAYGRIVDEGTADE